MAEIPVARAGSVDRSCIRVKAFAIILDETGQRHIVSRAQHQDGQHWHRLLGGSIELGERSPDAVVREIREELGATLVDPEYLGVLENVFHLDGELGHEVVFVYAGTLAEPDVVPDDGRIFHDLDVQGWVEWRPVTGDPSLPLFPEGAQELLDGWLERREARRTAKRDAIIARVTKEEAAVLARLKDA